MHACRRSTGVHVRTSLRAHAVHYALSVHVRSTLYAPSHGCGRRVLLPTVQTDGQRQGQEGIRPEHPTGFGERFREQSRPDRKTSSLWACIGRARARHRPSHQRTVRTAGSQRDLCSPVGTMASLLASLDWRSRPCSAVCSAPGRRRPVANGNGRGDPRRCCRVRCTCGGNRRLVRGFHDQPVRIPPAPPACSFLPARP